MDRILDGVKAIVTTGQKLARLLAAYRRLVAGSAAPTADREKALDGIAAAATALASPDLRAELDRWLGEERARVAVAREEFRFGFGGGLAAALGELGLTPRGQLPVVRAGLFSLRVDFEAGSAALYWGPEVEKLASGIGLASAVIARAVSDEQALLRKRAVEPERLGGLLREAYRRWCLVTGQAPGARAPLIELLSELILLIQPEAFRADPVRRRFLEYPRVQFSHDLYRLRQSPPGGEAPRLHVAAFDSTTSRA
ncbi:MAG: hypothetical protein R6X12_10650, partial [bacterium]